MKRHGNLFEKVVNLENIIVAHSAAKKGKQHYKQVKLIETNPELYCKKIQELLLSKKFTTSKYQVETIYDGRKMREIYKLPYFPDRIVQHALLQVCAPIWQLTFIRDTYQSIIGRGTHDARKRVQKTIRNNSPMYALKFDISKYYPSVNNEKLKQIIKTKIKCKDTLWLLEDIIDSNKGIPIGNYTSQYFGNLYLTPFDWWVKQDLKAKHYFRYCDDIVVLGDSAEYCHKIKNKMFKVLSEEYFLNIKNNWQVFPVEDRGLDFVGYVFSKKETRLRRGIAKGFKQKTKSIHRTKMKKSKAVNGIMSYWGWIKYANAKKLWLNQINKQIIELTNPCELNKNPIAKVMK